VTLPTICSVGFSTALLFLLCLNNAKRRRTAGMSAAPQSKIACSLLVGGTIFPGLFLAINGGAAASLIWLGCCAVAGWLITLLFSVAGQAR
jgi:hypothetical protein